MDTLASYAPALPEIVLAAGAMLLLMLGVFREDTARTGRSIGWLSIGLMAIVALLVGWGGADRVELFDGAYVSDAFSRFSKILILAAAAASLLLSFGYFERAKIMKFEIPVIVLLSTIGMFMMVSANDLISLYLGLELMSLALYVLAAVRRDSLRSSESGLKYFVLGALSSGMLLYGASLIYGFTGTTSFTALAAALKDGAGAQNVGLIVGLVFLLVGLAFKISAVPFHMWTPDVYEGAPTPVTAFFAGAPKVAAVALLLRVLHDAFPGMLFQWQQIIVFLSVASMLLGSFAAIGQTSIKRLLAFSSIANVGFILIGLAAGTEYGVSSVLIYLAIYVVMTLGSFAVVLAMRRKDEMDETIQSLAGLSQTNLPMAVAFAALLFSMAGIPPLAGFFAKFYVFDAAIKAGLTPLVVVGALSSVVGAFYYLRVVKIMFFDEPADKFSPADAGVRWVLGLSAALVIFYVVYPAPLIDAANAAARALVP
ncbi:MAG: NADH-quinone oxidoreductase subunit N [Hyphomicrobium sp. 32-62-53]|nr:MAG: NADH-quinone oxidoreductase subunit N [Hyphomicrobium sp. 12-62-95]OYX99561.1 MAG: NADH-quinone oxidoreductase subunit N [Hyphomicrobium sp. 32-62-53]